MNQELPDRKLFGEDFIWGVSTSALQTEGSASADGKGKSIWDEFAGRKYTIKSKHTPENATEFYKLYKKDIQLLRKMNIKNFRFSISWPRLFPDGFNFNSKGADFYDRLIDELLENEITPWATLYHWDLPLDLEKKGGWTNRNIIYWFEKYTYACLKKYGDRIQHWMIMNEPVAFTGAGYFLGIHAPGRRGLNNFLPAIHHTVMTICNSNQIIKELYPKSERGTTFSTSLITPFSERKSDQSAAKRVDVMLNRMFPEAICGMGYPMDDLPVLRRIEKHIMPGDLSLMNADFDFFGLQNYTREVVAHSWFTPYLKAKMIPANKRNVPTTKMNWEIYPEGIFEVLKKFSSYPFVKKIIITENGASFNDQVIENKVCDYNRRDFIQEYIKQVYYAQKAGIPVKGYFVWSFTDNFEWSEGYTQRFGLVHIDFETQERIIKESGKWYSNFLKNSDKNEITSGYSIQNMVDS